MENFENFLSFFKKDITISGRIPLWNLLLQTSIKEHLWFGYGFNAYWQRWMGSESPANNVVINIVGNGRDWVAHAHNGFLDIILNIGVIGLVLFICLFLINVPLIILTFTFITNLFNSPIIIPSFIWFLFVIVTIRLNNFGYKQLSRAKLSLNKW